MNTTFPMVFDQDSSQHKLYRTVGFGVLAVIAVILWLYLPEFQVKRMNRMLAMAVAILGLNLVVGFSGLLALCQSAFIALGAFVTATLVVDHGWDYWMTIPMVMLATFSLGLILGIPALKIKGLYLAMATVAFAAAFPSMTKLELHLPPSWLPGDFWRGDLSIADRTGGANGRALAEANGRGEELEPTWFPWFENESQRYRFIFIAGIAILCFWTIANLVKSRPGRAVISIRDNEIGAAVSGVNLRYFKVLNFGLSAILGGLAGFMWAMTSGFVAEQDFTFVLMVDLLVGLVVGGVGTISGAMIGAVVVVFGRWLVQTYFNYSLTAVMLWGLLLGGALWAVKRFDTPILKQISAAGAALIGIFLLLPMLGLNAFGPLAGLGFSDMGGGAGFDWLTFLAILTFVIIAGMLATAVMGAVGGSAAVTRAGAFLGILAGGGALGTWIWSAIEIPGVTWLILATLVLAWLAYKAAFDPLVSAAALATGALIAICWFQDAIGLNGWITALLVLTIPAAAGYFALEAPEGLRRILAAVGVILAAGLTLLWIEERTNISNGLYQLDGNGPLSQAIFGIVLIVVVFFAPQGIVGAWRKAWSNAVQIRPVPPALPDGITAVSSSNPAMHATDA